MAEGGDGIKLLQAYVEFTTKGLESLQSKINRIRNQINSISRQRTVKIKEGVSVTRVGATLDSLQTKLDNLTSRERSVKLKIDQKGKAPTEQQADDVAGTAVKAAKKAQRKVDAKAKVRIPITPEEPSKADYRGEEQKKLEALRGKVGKLLTLEKARAEFKRKAAAEILSHYKAEAKAIHAQEKAKLKQGKQLFNNDLNRLVERTNLALREQRRQLGALGGAGLAYRNKLEKAFDYESLLRRRMKAAQIVGDDKAIANTARRYEEFARKARRTVTVLNYVTIAVRTARIAWQGLKAAMTFGVSIITSMIGGFLRLAKTVAMVPIKAFNTGIRALFAPTLGLLSLFRQLRSYATMIFGGGLFFVAKSSIESFSELEETVGRATGNIGLLGKDAIKTFTDLKNVARETATATLVPLDQVSRGLEELARGGIADPFQTATDKVMAMRRALENTARLSLISGIDTQDTAKLVAVITNQFGEIGKEADDLADTLAKAQSLAPVTLNDIRQAIEVSGSAARNAGLDFTEYAALVTQSMQRITSGSRSGTALSRTLIQSMLPDNAEAANRILGRVGKSIDQFLDDTGQRYRKAVKGGKGGFSGFIEALSQAGAGIVDLEAIFGFKSREFINLLDQSSEGLLRMTGIVKQLRQAQRDDFTKVFEDFLKNNTLFGALRNLQIRFTDLKVSITELARGNLIRFFNQLAGFVSNIKRFVDTSGALRGFLEGVGTLASNLRSALAPVVTQFARISLFVNTVLIASLAKLATIVAKKVQPYFEKAGRSVAKFFGMGDLTFTTWGQTFNNLAKILYNFDTATTAVINHMKARLAELSAVMLKIMAGRDAGEQWKSFAERASRAIGLIKDEFVAFAIFAGNTLAYSLEYAIKRLVSSGIIADLGLEFSRVAGKRIIPDIGIPFTDIKFNPVDAAFDSGVERMKKMRNGWMSDFNDRVTGDFATKLESAVSDFAKRQGTILPKALGADEFLGAGDKADLDKILGKLESARIKWEGIRDEQLKLMKGLPAGMNASLKIAEDRLSEINRAYDRTIAKRGGDSEGGSESRLMGLEEFQRSLQDGAQYERLQVDEQRKTNRLLQELITTSKAIKIGGGRTVQVYPMDTFMTRFD